MDFDKYVGSKAYSFFDNLYKLMVVNIIWFVLMIIGFGFLTFLPATISVFIIVNSLIQEKDLPLFKSFWMILRKEYLKAQKIFIVMFLIGLILYVNIKSYYIILIKQQDFISSIGFWITCVLIVIYVFTFIQLFFIFLYFPEFKTFKTIKYAFLFSLAFPFRSILLLIIFSSVAVLLMVYPITIPLTFLFVISGIAYLSIRVMTPKYDAILKDSKPVNVYDYID